LFTPSIFEAIERTPPGYGGEIQITDAMQQLGKMQPFYGLKFEGRAYDCGSKIGFLGWSVEDCTLGIYEKV
jgi:UTP--glucose-1-phosphate uridylyltransferase